jgi:outer membrane protein
MKILLQSVLIGLVLMGLAAASPATLGAAEYGLEDLFRIALASSEKLKIAEENLTIAEIGQDKAKSYLYPRVTATGGLVQYSQRKLTSTGSVLQPDNAASWGLRIEETLSLSGRELTALGIARQSIAKSRYDLAALREEYLLRHVATAYYQVLMARKNLDIAEANLGRLARYRDAAEKRLRIGEVTRTVLLRAEGELSGAKSDQLQAKNGLELAKALLASQVGIEEDFTLRHTPPGEGEVPPLVHFNERAFALRADLQSQEIQKRMVADQIRYAEGAFWPSLTLSGVYAGAEQSPATANLNRESIYGGIALTFPFFEGGLRKAEVAEAKARLRQASHQVEDLKKGIEIEVRTAYLDLTTQKGILRFLSDQLVYARDNYHAILRQFEFGLASSLDIMDANTLLVSAERRAASAAYNFELALLRLKKAAGMLYPALPTATP